MRSRICRWLLMNGPALGPEVSMCSNLPRSISRDIAALSFSFLNPRNSQPGLW